MAAPVALAATASVVGLGVATTGSDAPADAPSQALPAAAHPSAAPAAPVTSAPATTAAPVPSTSAPTAATTPAAPRAKRSAATGSRPGATNLRKRVIVSRSDGRDVPLAVEKDLNLTSEVATRRAIRAAKAAGTQLWTTTALDLWTAPGRKAEVDGELESGRHVLVTGREIWGRSEVVVEGRARWVTDGYLSDEEPVVTGAAAGLSMEPCPDGSVENGLTDAAVRVYRSVCHAFPQITSYGGWDAHGEHASGRAVDIMTSDVALGTSIAEYLRAHAAELDLYDIIWRQRIFTQERAGEGWRGMPSRGSATADHYDHVHVATY